MATAPKQPELTPEDVATYPLPGRLSPRFDTAGKSLMIGGSGISSPLPLSL
jgi:hypothetical protein